MEYHNCIKCGTRLELLTTKYRYYMFCITCNYKGPICDTAGKAAAAYQYKRHYYEPLYTIVK